MNNSILEIYTFVNFVNIFGQFKLNLAIAIPGVNDDK